MSLVNLEVRIVRTYRYGFPESETIIIKGAPPIAADPGGFPDFRILGFFGKCGFLEFSGGIWGLGGFAMDWKWLWASNGRILSPFRAF